MIPLLKDSQAYQGSGTIGVKPTKQKVKTGLTELGDRQGMSALSSALSAAPIGGVNTELVQDFTGLVDTVTRTQDAGMPDNELPSLVDSRKSIRGTKPRGRLLGGKR